METVVARRDVEVASFTHALDETPDLWQSIDVRVITVRIGDAWHNLVARFRLDARVPEEIPPVSGLPETDKLACCHTVYPLASLPNLLNQLRAGVIHIADRTVHACARLEDASTTETVDRSYLDAYASLSTRQYAVSSVVQPRDFLAHRLLLRPGVSMPLLTDFLNNGRRAVDRELLGLECPFDGIAGLCRVVVQSSIDSFDVPQIEIIAPLGAALHKEQAHLEAGELRGTVWAASAATAGRCTVGYVAEIEDGTFQNGTVHLEGRWSEEADRRATFTLQLGSAARRVTLFLRLGRHLIESHPVLDQSVGRTPLGTHLTAYLVMDPGLALLQKALHSTEALARKKAGTTHQFERAIAQLFSLAGFHTDALGGYPGVQQAVDVLARSPDGGVLLPIECTLGALSSVEAKPDRLMRRAAELRLALTGADVVPIMITSRSRSALLSGDVNFIAGDDIIVLCREELDELIQLVKRGATPSDVIVFCRQYLPKNAAKAANELAFAGNQYIRG